MKFYSIKNSIDDIGEGGFPQSQTIDLDHGRTVRDYDFIWNIHWNQKPNFQPYIGTIVLEDKSTLTDFISSATVSSGFLCSERAKKIIDKYDNGQVYFYPLNVRHKNNIYTDYWYLHCTNDISDNIDLPNCLFQLFYFDGLTKFTNPLQIESAEMLEEINEKLLFRRDGSKWTDIEPTRIKFKSGFQITDNIFNIGRIDFKQYVSDQLKTELEKHNITGIRYNETMIFA